EVILNGDSHVPTRIVEGVSQPVAPTTAEQRLARKNELKTRGTLLMALPDKHQLKFNSHIDAKTLMEAINKRFGRNTKTKKVQKTILKHQFENFTGSKSEGLDQIHDRIQKLVSQLEINKVSLSQEDVTLKFLRSLPSEWKTHTLKWRNKADLEEQNLDDLFNSLKIYETKVKQSSSPVSAAASVSAACVKLPASPLPNIDVDDLEKIDLRWQMAMLTMRARRFLQKTGRNLGANGPTYMGFDISKVECYNCHRKGHFARECSYDWSYQAEDEPANFILRAFSSNSSSDNEFDVISYQTGLEYVEARLLVYKQNESVFEESIKLLNIEVQLRDTALVTLRHKLEKAKQERDDLKLTLEKFQTFSKNLTDLLASQTNMKTGFQPSGGYHVVPPPYTGTFMPPKPDLIFHTAPTAVETDNLAFNPIETTFQAVTSVPASPKSNSSGKIRNRKACFVCKSVDNLIKECDYHSKKMAQPTPRNYANRHHHKQYALLSRSKPQKHRVPTAVLTQSKPVSNTTVRPVSAALPNITVTRPRHAHQAPVVSVVQGNMSYLSDFEELNGGYVAFGGNPKGAKITGKGKIKTGKLDFDDVYFVKELKFNLFSVSQICDKKNSVLFTDTECLVLSFDFKLPDESQVLLRVPKENNMYNVNLKNIVPSRDLTCLFAKSTLDESNLWHRRLAHVFFLATKDETTPILKTFLTGLENQLSLKTLIEAARTMLADSLLPISFWVEAVNTACYVQNRVLVTKPHNKTPYELLHGKTPSIGFMRPFGCLVTILNTLDPLGKFQRKVDEGFLVGYSVCSKAFKVFNSITRIIQETLHVNFLENKPNVAGTGPTWLFDIDSLTRTMNYQPVHTGNQTNSGVGFQDNLDAKKAGEEVDQSYMLFPVWSSVGFTNPQKKAEDAAFDGKEHDFDIKKPESIVILSPSSSAQSKEQDDKTMKEAKRKSHVESVIGYRDLNAEFQDCSENSSNEVTTASSTVPTVGQNSLNSTNTFSADGPSNTAVSPTYGQTSDIDSSQLPDDLDMPGLEDIIYSDDEDVVGAEADFNNLVSSIPVSPIPTTRIHKYHPVSQIIGDLSSTTQTRSMTRAVKDQDGLSQMFSNDFHTCMFACFLSQEEPKRVHQAFKDPSWIEAMQEELLLFKMQKIWVLVDLPYGKRAIGTKWVYKNKKDERGIVTRNKARFVAQGHTREERIDYEEVFAPVARIEAIRLFLAYASFIGFMVYQMDVKSAFLYETIKEKVYVCQPLGFEDPDHPDKVYKVVKALYALHQAPRAWLTEGKSTSTPIDTEKPLLKDHDVCTCACFQVIPKASHLHAVKRIFRYLKGKPHLGLWYPKDLPFDLVAYSDSDYAGASLDRKSTTGGCQFLGCRLISWQFEKQTVVATSSTEAEYVAAVSCCTQSNDVTRLQALVNKKKVVITEAIIRDALRLDDVEGVDCLPNEEIFAELARMGYEKPSTKLTFYKAFFSSQWKFLIHTILQSLSAKRTSWNDFSSAIASAVICLSTGQKFNFFKYIFESLVRNVDSSSKFYMYPRFIQVIIQNQLGVETPLFEGMLVAGELKEQGDAEEQVQDDVDDNVAQGDDIAVSGDDIQDQSIPSHIPPTLPPQQSQDLPSTSQEALDACVILARCVEHLEYDKVAQALEITKLKRKVKQLERGNKVKVLKLRRLKKIGTSQRIKSSDDTGIEDASNQGRMIDEFDRDEGVALMDNEGAEKKAEEAQVAGDDQVKGRQAEIYQIDMDHALKVLKVVTAASESVTATNTTIAAAEPQVPAATITVAPDVAIDHVKQKAKEDLYVQRYQIEEEENRAIQSINETPAQKAAKRRKLNEEVEDLKQHLEIVPDEDDDVYTEATPQARKVPVVDYELILLVERRYPLSRFTLDQMLNALRLRVEEQSEMSLELLRFTRQQHQEGQLE
nr:hypothetical protein [Tanacetum cinerariifolium]